MEANDTAFSLELFGYHLYYSSMRQKVKAKNKHFSWSVTPLIVSGFLSLFETVPREVIGCALDFVGKQPLFISFGVSNIKSLKLFSYWRTEAKV